MKVVKVVYEIEEVDMGKVPCEANRGLHITKDHICLACGKIDKNRGKDE